MPHVRNIRPRALFEEQHLHEATHLRSIFHHSQRLDTTHAYRHRDAARDPDEDEEDEDDDDDDEEGDADEPAVVREPDED
ncbi:hypothetical protein [Bradyrhizobium liaoningense]